MALTSENQLFADLIRIIRDGLVALGVDGWTVMQDYQPTEQGLRDKLIKLNKVYSRKIGAQGNADEKRILENGEIELVHKEFFQKEISIQLDFYVKSTVAETVDSITGADMAQQLACYFSGVSGVQALLEAGYGMLRIENIRDPKHVLDSNLYQVLPGFDLVLRFWQEIEMKQQAAVIKGFRIIGV